ncbi:MAG TPA: hypothetical protein VFQ85_10830 [Mycobacteriales bacterium]|jgi:hypothetical protein|nr:hypothetical protein [Mycobacteriales bacterium]
MRPLVAAVLVAAALAVPGGASGGAAFEVRSSLGGGVTDLGTGRVYQPQPEENAFARGRVTVVPYRAGLRLRVPLVLSLADGVGAVELVDVRVLTAPGSTVRPAGAVIGAHCCTLEDASPVRGAVVRRRDGQVVVGVDVELCCDPPPGWVEPLAGVEVLYRRDGVPGRYVQPFPDIQRVVVRA